MTAPSTTAFSPSAITSRGQAGFTLTELAVVFMIVAILLSSVLYTLSAQSEQRGRDESMRRLESARDLLLGFALLHGRLPCPASAASNGDESPAGGGACTNYQDGFLPARTIGYRPMDANGFGIDAWGQRIRYAVARTAVDPSVPASGSCATPPADHAFSVTANLKMGSVGCAPVNLVVCDAAQNTQPAATPTSPNPPTCGVWAAAGDARAVTNQRTVVAVIFSTGKNTGLPCPGCVDEAENLDNDGVFVWHDARPAGALAGEYDDLVVWLPVGQLYGRLIAAGVLP